MNFYEKKKVVEKKEEKKEQPFNLIEFIKENVSNLAQNCWYNISNSARMLDSVYCVSRL